MKTTLKPKKVGKKFLKKKLKPKTDVVKKPLTTTEKEAILRQKRDLQKWNYQVHRKLGYSAEQARKMRNRTPPTTLNLITARVKLDYETKTPHPIRRADFPRVPKRAVNAKHRKEVIDYMMKTFKFSRKEASRYNRLSYTKFMQLKERVNGFVNFVLENGSVLRPGYQYDRQEVLDNILELMRDRSMKGFFRALRRYYNTKIGVPV